jgi:hypothetical protein
MRNCSVVDFNINVSIPKREKDDVEKMSLDGKNVESDAKEIELQKSADGFERFIMQCCKADEWDLRKFLKKVLGRAGFTIFEDGYLSERCKTNSKYNTVHNMLAIRGENPRVALVAHTDVCRNHGSEKYEDGESDEYAYWMGGVAAAAKKTDTGKKRIPLKVRPVIKEIEQDGKVRRIITDKENRIQVGGDDRLGVAMNCWLALNAPGYPMGLLFPTDEEIGLKSASVCEMPQLKDFDLLVQTDRGNHSNELVVKIGGEILMSYSTTVRLLEIAYDIGLPRYPVHGMGTDIYAIKKRNMCKEACNLTVGYHNSRGDSADEYIDIQEAKDSLRYISEIVKDFYLNE